MGKFFLSKLTMYLTKVEDYIVQIDRNIGGILSKEESEILKLL